MLGSKEPLTERRVKEGLYEWSEGKLALISVLPAGEGAAAVAGELGDGIEGVVADARHAVSGDGSRVVWTSGGGKPHLYLWDRAGEETVRLDPGLEGTPRFQAAAADGSVVFFTESGGADDGDLFEFVVDEGRLVRLTSAGGVLGTLPGVSEDGSFVYFVANGVLAKGAVHGGCGLNSSPLGALCDLYVWHGGVVSLVAVLSGADTPDWSPSLAAFDGACVAGWAVAGVHVGAVVDGL